MAFPADVLINKASARGEKSGEKCVTGALETWEVGLVVALLLLFGLFGLLLVKFIGYLRICEMSVTETVPSAARCMALLCAHCDIIT